MANPSEAVNSKFNIISKKIAEVKKKIQLSEGQRKATFEECDAKKRENVEKIACLKKEVKDLQLEFARTKNNVAIAERIYELSKKSSANIKKRNFEEAIITLDDDNIRLRKKFDLMKYERQKQKRRLALLLQEYEELMDVKDGSVQPITKSETLFNSKKKIIKLENQLHRVNIMQMEAETVRKKYRAVKSSLKADASFYASCLDEIEENIKDQEGEIKRLVRVKEESIELRDITKNALFKQEQEANIMSKERQNLIQDYRKRVEDRRLDLERLERVMFSTTRPFAKDDLDTDREKGDEEESSNVPKTEIEILEETFVKLRNVTGVSKAEDVLGRFLGQNATKEKLKKMQAIAEEDKMILEKQRQQLTYEIEIMKFSETKESDQNADKLAKLQKQIKDQRDRQARIGLKILKTQDLMQEAIDKLSSFCKLIQEKDPTLIIENVRNFDSMKILKWLRTTLAIIMSIINGKSEKMLEFTDKMEDASVASFGDQPKMLPSEQPLFPLFPTITSVQSTLAQHSEDEDEIPSRTYLKRQAQILVDSKSRRKGFPFKR